MQTTTHIEGDQFADRDFRRGIWRQTTTAVALVTSTHGGRTNVMACEWASMVSTSPLVFAVSVHPSHETYGLIDASGEFGLSFCWPSQATLSHVSGSYSMRDTDKWSLADFVTYPATKIAAPMIDGCYLNVECRVVAKQPLGHTVFFGEAVWARYVEDGSPLLYHGGRYFHLGEQVAKPQA